MIRRRSLGARLKAVLLALLVVLGAAWSIRAEEAEPPATTNGESAVEAVSPPVQPQGEGSPLDALRQAVDRETKRVREHLDSLEAFSVALERGMKREAEAHGAAMLTAATLGAEISSAEPDSSQITELYFRAVAMLREQGADLRTLLERWDEASRVPTFHAEPSWGSLTIPELQTQVRELRELWARARAETSQLRERELELRALTLEHAADRLQNLSRLCTAAVRKSAYGGWGWVFQDPRASLDAIFELFEQLELMGRFALWQRWRVLGGMASLAGALAVLGSAAYVLVKVLIVVALLSWLLDRIRKAAEERRKARDPWRFERPTGVEGLLSVVEIIAPWSLFLIGVWSTKKILEGAIRWPELDYLLLVATAYGVYRWILDALTGGVELARMSLRSLRMTGAHRAELIAGFRTVLRTAFLLWILLVPVKWIIDGGLLYDLLFWVACLVFLGVTLITLERRRLWFLEAYDRVAPDGRLQGWVRSSSTGWRAWVAAPIAWVTLIRTLSGGLARDLAFRIRPLRHLVILWSRERHDEEEVQARDREATRSPVPAALVDSVTAERVTDELLVPRSSGQQGFAEALSAWRAGESLGAFLLTGESGVGKRCWLDRMPVEGDEEVVRASVADRVGTATGFAEFLGPRLDGGSRARWDLDALTQELLGGPRRVVVLDTCEHLFLACVGGYRPFEAFLEVVEATGSRVFWVCSMIEAAWGHLLAVRGGPAPFRWHQPLVGWAVDEIRQLIRIRTSVSGVKVALDPVGLSTGRMGTQRSAEAVTEEEYSWLLWERAMGNPAAALDIYLHSLAARSPTEVRARVPEEPKIEDVGWGVDTAPLLAALTTHGSLTLEEAAAVLHLPQASCTIGFGRLADLGVLQAQTGRHRIAPRWMPTAKRYLKRSNLLSG